MIDVDALTVAYTGVDAVVAGSYEAPAGPGPDQAIVRRGKTTMRDWAAGQEWPNWH